MKNKSPNMVYISHQIPDYRNAVIVAKNPNSVKRASSYAERLRLSIAVIHGEDKIHEADRDDGRYSPPLYHKPLEFGIEMLPGTIFSL